MHNPASNQQAFGGEWLANVRRSKYGVRCKQLPANGIMLGTLTAPAMALSCAKYRDLSAWANSRFNCP